MASMKELMRKPKGRMAESKSGGGKGPRKSRKAKSVSVQGRTPHEMAKRFSR